MFRVVAVVFCLALACGPAAAWKPTTHAYLAQQAINDALDDGHVDIPILGTTMFLRYKVPSETLEALRTHLPQYRAGVLGPDAYPDMITGQVAAHPPHHDSKVEGGTNSWLRHVWTSFGATPAEHAFRLGYFTHAAGDIFGHSFVNRFAGGPFAIDPSLNFVRHMAIEGYVDKRLPNLATIPGFFNASIAGLEMVIYQKMVDAKPGTPLSRLMPHWGPLIPEGEFDTPGDIVATIKQYPAILSVPRSFSLWRAELVAYTKSCGLLDPFCPYAEAWIEDIDLGLKAWPAFSHSVALALFFNNTRKVDKVALQGATEDYSNRYFLSMAGYPDGTGAVSQMVSDLVDKYMPERLKKALDLLKTKMMDSLLRAAFGLNTAQVTSLIENPECSFDDIVAIEQTETWLDTWEGAKACDADPVDSNAPSTATPDAAAIPADTVNCNLPQLVTVTPMTPVGEGDKKRQPITLADFNRSELGIDDDGYKHPECAFDYRMVPATYNTVLLSKLVLLGKDGINELQEDLSRNTVSDVRSDAGLVLLAEDNIMLGFIASLDGDRQWNNGLVLAQDCAVYNQIFMPMTDMPCTPRSDVGD